VETTTPRRACDPRTEEAGTDRITAFRWLRKNPLFTAARVSAWGIAFLEVGLTHVANIRVPGPSYFRRLHSFSALTERVIRRRPVSRLISICRSGARFWTEG
jgi:hypothetical protein